MLVEEQVKQASIIATDLWNIRVRKHPIKIVIKNVFPRGNQIIADAMIFFQPNITVMDGEFIICERDDPLGFVYGWMECVEESFHMIFEQAK